MRVCEVCDDTGTARSASFAEVLWPLYMCVATARTVVASVAATANMQSTTAPICSVATVTRLERKLKRHTRKLAIMRTRASATTNHVDKTTGPRFAARSHLSPKPLS